MTLLSLHNPVWTRSDNLRDPAVLPVEGGYWLFYSRYSNRDWSKAENWAVACVFTPDFKEFTGDRDLTPKGFASPGDPVRWAGHWVLPYQSYPLHPSRLFFSESTDGERWSDPQPFMPQANELPWNTRRRCIDPSFVVDGDQLHCFFVGSCDLPVSAGNAPDAPVTARPQHANLVGHAVTSDPALQHWQILTPSQPMLGITERAPDGSENVMVIRTGPDNSPNKWTMIYSEGLAAQHLAYAISSDLLHWQIGEIIQLLSQPWMEVKHGAPFVWRESERWWMILMGEDRQGQTSFGLLHSTDAIHWDAVKKDISPKEK
jgi:sucrose-6-phosphate hydrolase SacC (GH32 family)